MFVFLAAGHLFNLATSISQYILVTSPRYKLDLYINGAFLVLVVATNYFFIQLYGGVGAAAATMCSILLINFIKWGVLKHFYGLNPLSWRQLGLAGLAAGVFFGFKLVPELWNPFFDIVARSALITLVFVALALATRITPEVNKTVYIILEKLRERLP